MHLVKTCEIRLDPHGEMSKERRNRSTKSPYWNRKSSTTKKFSAGSSTALTMNLKRCAFCRRSCPCGQTACDFGKQLDMDF